MRPSCDDLCSARRSGQYRPFAYQCRDCFWDYAEASTAHIFGASLGDDVADEIARALQHSPEGISRTAIRDLFGRNQSAGRIGAALALLASRGRARVGFKETSGRPVEIWTPMEASHG